MYTGSNMNRFNLQTAFLSKIVNVFILACFSQSLFAQLELSGSVIDSASDSRSVELIIENTEIQELSNIEIITTGLGDSVFDCSTSISAGVQFNLNESTLAPSSSIFCNLPLPIDVDRLSANISVVATNGLGETVVSRTSLDAIFGSIPAQQAIVSILLGSVHIDNDSDFDFTVDDELNFTYTVVNTGQLDLTGLNITDTLGNFIVCPSTILASGASLVCTSVFDIAVAAPTIENSATLNAITTIGPITDTDLLISLPLSDTTAVSNLVKSPSISDDVNGDGFASIGDEITYTFIFKNANLQPLTLDALVDPLIDLSAINCNATTENGAVFDGIGTGILASQDTVLCAATLIVDVDDRTNGQINNTVALTATSDLFESANTNASATVTVPSFQIIIEKITTNSNGTFVFDIINGDPSQVSLTTTAAGIAARAYTL